MNNNNERNPVGWFEIYVDDMNRAKFFYETVFATSLESLPMSDESIEMWNFPMSNAHMSIYGSPGALCKMEGLSGGAGGVIIYFGCEDCSIESSRVESAGGNVLKPKFAIGEYGFISLVLDTEGNTVGLHSMK